MFVRATIVAAALVGWSLDLPAANAEHWSQGIATHSKGPVDLTSKPGLMGQVVNGTTRVVRAGVGIVRAGVTLPFKLTAGAVRAMRSDGSERATASRNQADSSAGFASVLSRRDASRPLTVTEWMQQPRPE